MKKIKAILACDNQGGVSKNGTLPWPHNSTDLQWFKTHTLNGIVVMGSTTWKDPHMPRPLPNRHNVLVTSTPNQYPGAHEYVSEKLCGNLVEINLNRPEQMWIIGGPNIINQTLEIIDIFYISRIPGDYNCDTFLPLDKIYKMFELIYSGVKDGVTFEIWSKK